MEHESEKVQRAIEWISAHLKEDPQASILKLIDKAEFQFDLDQKHSQFLYDFYKDSIKK